MIGENTNDTLLPEDETLLMELAADGAVSEDQTQKSSDEAEMAEDPTDGLQRQIAELTERLRNAEKDRQMRERELECLRILEEAGLPSGLATTVQKSDDMKATADLIRTTVQEMVEAEISRRCRSDAPMTGSAAPLTREELIRMPVAELQRLRDSGAKLG